MAAAAQTHEFKAEVTALLKLVTNSLYTNQEIFIRELISNASDALDRARFEALVDPGLRGKDEEPEIRIVADKARGVLVIEDNGIGMTRDEITTNLGTIAHSGTVQFLEAIRAQQDAGTKPDVDLIGQFGVGFYSAFMVSDRIDVDSLSARPDAEPVRWSSTGEGEFTLAPGDRQTRGTRIELHLSEGTREFLDRYRVESVVRRYSNYVMHPITFSTVGDDGGAADTPVQINEARAFWARPQTELNDEDYQEFYRHLMGGFVLPTDKPLARLHLSLDAPIQFQAVLMIPGRAPADLFTEDRRALQLFARRVMVIENCETLLPTYLRFLRGVVDSEDLPLNVSREMLQEHQSVSAIRRQLTRKVLRLLEDTAREDRERYEHIFSEFGSVIKEGIHTDNAHREQLTELLRYPTWKTDGKLRSLREYVDAMPEGQDAIYYIAGRSAQDLSNSPHLERCKSRDQDVLILTDAIDEWVVQDLKEYSGKPLRSVTQGDFASDEVDESGTVDPGDLAPTIELAKKILGQRVSDVRPSTRLRDSAACLVDPPGGLSRNMERILRLANQDMPTRARILELNPDNTFVKAVNELASNAPEDPRLSSWVELLHDQANLAEGHVPDPAGVVRRIASMLEIVGKND